MLSACDVAFKTKDQQTYKEARWSLLRGIKKAKNKYKQLIEEHFNSSNSVGHVAGDPVIYWLQRHPHTGRLLG